VAKRAKALARGRRGAVGRQGVAGQRGAVGPQGVTGAQGPPGPRLNKLDVLAMVDDQFEDIRKEMALQLSRMAQIQVQLDQIHAMVKTLVEQTLAK
jgi:hypothetical protein